MDIYEAARRARETADASVDRGDHALANALTAAVRTEEDQLLLDALVECGPAHGVPPWSQVSSQG